MTGSGGHTGEGPDPAIPPDAEKVRILRAIGDEIRTFGDTPESSQVAALVYRISDIYDDAEETDPRDVYVNMRQILNVRERGGKRTD